MPALSVNPLLSYGCRAGSDIRIVLVIEAGAETLGADVMLRLRSAELLDVPVQISPLTAGQTKIEALVPQQRLGNRTWKLKMVGPGGGGPRNLQTRVLVRDGMPVALLTGPPPNTLLRPPKPRPASSPSGARRPRGRAAALVGRWRRRVSGAVAGSSRSAR